MSSFQPEFLQKLRNRVVLSEVVSPTVRLAGRGKEMLGLCPFHKEKSPSFTLNDEKGIYYCFGCGAHGDAISFLRAMHHLTFVEAVTFLAEKTGLSLELSETGKHFSGESGYKRLYLALERACVYFEAQLATSWGEKARAYLQRRGVSSLSQKEFRLGWAPVSNASLQRQLQQEGFSADELVQAGLIGISQNGGGFYDRFKERLTFPIMDAQGRVIAFGGRLLEPHPKAPKYLNSPETPLFFKKQSVYGAFQARRSQALKDKPVIWVEGYMDVISLQQAGMGKALAPLGTSLTEPQIAKAWQIDPEPFVCFDGDLAGQKAAFRLVERVLPLLKPGCSFRFIRLPIGEDPDSLLVTDRRALLERLIETAFCLVDFLWQYHVETLPLQTPEQKAFFHKTLKTWVGRIQDPEVKSLYYLFLQKKWDQLLKEERKVTRQKPVNFSATKHASFSQKSSVPKPLFDLLHLQRKILLAVLINHPHLLEEVNESLVTLDLPEQSNFSCLRDALLEWSAEEGNLISQENVSHFLKNALIEKGLAEVMHRILTSDVYVHASFSRPEALLEQAREGWHDVLTHYQKQSSFKKELKETQKTLESNMSEDAWKRLRSLKESSFFKMDS
ncbi:MAG: DNA primase [Alphaproteobacteria bacterium]